ncbi:ATP-binding protein [Streptomyces rubiginosohelvolus]|uniref:ATP-binding protein n=1 Tax=Streptomyces rubiginosohelvolus TaxID=67362 RepID=UPI0035D5A305
MSVVTDTSTAAPARGLNAFGAVSAHVFNVMKNNGADMSQLGVPSQPPPEDGLWEDIAVPQARARKRAWLNSVQDASQGNYLKFRFQDLDENQRPSILQKWLDSLGEAKKKGAQPAVLNMIIPGNIGSGKSTAAITLGNEAVEVGIGALLIKHATYLTYRRPDMAPHNLTTHQVRQRFVTCDLLILDEFCGEMDMTATEAARRETVDLIDSRMSSGLPTAFTTNLRSRRQPGSTGLGIVDILGERLLSRLEERAHLVKIQGPDRRKPATPLDW